MPDILADTIPAALKSCLSAGETLGALGEPHRDISSYIGEFSDLGDRIKGIGRDIERALERGEERYDAVLAGKPIFPSLLTPDLRANLARTAEETAGRTEALRLAKLALIDLAALVTAVNLLEPRT